MAPRTIFLCRLMGLFLTIMAVALMVRPDAWVAAMMQDAALLLVLGLIMLAAGLALVLVHNRWSGGVPTVVVTVLGWIVLLKGVLMLAVPVPALAALSAAVVSHLAIPLVINLALGLYLTVVGFRRCG